MRSKNLFIVWLSLFIWTQGQCQNIAIEKDALTKLVQVKGNCRFVWNELLDPLQFEKFGSSVKWIPIPGSWKDIGYPDIGFGTYRISISLPQRVDNYSILFPLINSSAMVWLNGNLVDQLGVCNLDPKKYKAKFGSLLIALPSDTTSIDLTVRVINFTYSRGGIVGTPLIGPTSVLLQQVNNRRGVENFFVGSLIAMFIYQITLFFLYQRGKPYLYLGLICLIVALRAMVTHGGSFLLPDLFANVSMEFWKKMEFFSVYAVVAIFPLYTYHLFPQQSFRKPIFVFVGLSFLLCITVILTPHHIYAQVLDVCHIALIGGFIYSVIVIVRAWRAGNRDARIILVGVLASFPFIILEIVQNSRIVYFSISFSYLVEIGVLIFLLFQVYLLANHYAAAYRNLELVNVDLESKIRARTAELTKANQVREKLLSVVSHDIKSPLNSLRGVLNVYQQGGFTENEMKSLTGHLDESLSSTTMLVDNILLWTTSQLKGVKVNSEKINLKQFVDEHVRIFKTIAENKSISLIILVEETGVHTDRQILSLVLRNLIANAIKFSFEKGEIKISSEHSNKGFKLFVSDKGKGMMPEVAQMLFQSKSNVSTEGTGLEKGTGLGLALCYEYLQHVGGEISVQSEHGKGTTFAVWIPRSG